MSRRTPHKSITAKRAFALLLTVADDSRDPKWRLKQCHDALAEHVNAALDRPRRSKRAAKARAA
ncbi:MAG: hypothetical protein WDO74_17100 [Pseudomonadota bacterium]